MDELVDRDLVVRSPPRKMNGSGAGAGPLGSLPTGRTIEVPLCGMKMDRNRRVMGDSEAFQQAWAVCLEGVSDVLRRRLGNVSVGHDEVGTAHFARTMGRWWRRAEKFGGNQAK